MNVVRVVESFEDAARTLSDVARLNFNEITTEDLDSLASTVSRLESRLHDINEEISSDIADLDTRLELAYAQRDVLESRRAERPAPGPTASGVSERTNAQAPTRKSPALRSPHEIGDTIPAIHGSQKSPVEGTDHAGVGLVTEEEFAGISSYMRGRLTVEKVNKAVVELTHHAESNREMVLAVRKGIAGKRFDRKHALWLSNNVIPVIKNSGSKYFVVDQDLKRGSHLLPGSNSSRSILTILRHLGRIAETRLTVDGKSHVVYSLLYLRA